VDEAELVLLELPGGITVVSILGVPTADRPSGHAFQVRQDGRVLREAQNLAEVSELLGAGLAGPKV
jgi:hypothetical protein